MSKKVEIDGVETEVFSPEEVETIKSQARQEGADEKVVEIEKLQVELKSKTEEITKLSGKEHNFANLREINERLAAEKQDIEKKLSEAIGGIRQEGQAEKVNTAIARIAGDDEELAKQIKHHFDNTLKAVEPKGQKELDDKISKAANLAGVSIAPTSVPGVFTSGGSKPIFRGNAAGQGGGNKEPLSAGQKGLGSKLGLTEKDMTDPKLDKQDFSSTE